MDPQVANTGEGEMPQDTGAVTEPQDPMAGEGAKAPQDPTVGEDTKGKANIHKLEADIRRREKTIEELKAKLAEREGAAKTSDERIAELERRFAESERARAEADLTARLTGAGCIDCKAADRLAFSRGGLLNHGSSHGRSGPANFSPPYPTSSDFSTAYLV